MGYLTQDHISQSGVFRSKIALSVTKLVETAIDSTNPKHAAMARRIIAGGGNAMDTVVKDLTKLLALDDLDLDSTDTEVDTAIAAHLDWLVIKAGVEAVE